PLVANVGSVQLPLVVLVAIFSVSVFKLLVVENPYPKPAVTRLEMRLSVGGTAVAPEPKSSQATVTSPPSFWLITSCGCESSCGPRLPFVLTVVTPLKANDSSFPDGLAMGVA